MFRSYWREIFASLGAMTLIAITAGSIILVWSQYQRGSNEYQEYQQRAQSDQRQSAAKISENCAVPNAPTSIISQCLVDELAANERNSATDQDLKAQQDMAFWAFWMVVLGGIGIPLNIAGLIAIFISLSLGREANKASRDAVAITRDIGNKQLRPYIVFDAAKFKIWHTDDRSKSFLKVTIRFRNCGLSPGILTATSNSNYSPKKTSGWGPTGSSWRPLRVVIGPSQTEGVEFDGITADKDGKFSWFTIGILIWYENLFGEGFEEHVWLTFNGREMSQAYSTQSSFTLYRPDST